MKTLFTFLKIFISLILVITAISYIFITDQIKGPGGELITVNIPKGSSGSDIAAILKQKQVIKNPLLFKAALRIHPPERLSAGSFKLDPSKNIFETIESLQSSEPEMHLTTIPEGLTAEEIAELLAKNRLCLKNEFMALISENKYSIGGKELKSIDGYLFPETYDFGENINCDQIIKTMLGEFERRFYPIYRQHKDDMPLPMTLDKVVILASLVEREAQVPEERPIIAGVYFNRLKKGMKLECDATVMFALDTKKEILLYRDLEIDSPYNTYKYKGLPPGAIANPGIESLKAVIYPEKHDYYYYVRNDVKNDGSHVFSKTFQEHNDAIHKYQR